MTAASLCARDALREAAAWQADALTYRLLAHEATSLLHDAHRQLAAKDAYILSLRQEIAALCAERR